ncbi:MAG: BspA family leucine-rich repeat surface protein [Prevotella sp.]|nr:BspA family leucine-rich repeat surface protein [Prevotella sp.]
MKKITFTLLALLAIAMQASAAEYDLYVFGHKVTDSNRSDILGDGTVSYNSSTNMLTFNNATINAGPYECVYNKINGLTIRFIGTNSLTSSNELAIYSDTEGELTLTGTGSVSLKGYSALYHAGTLLKIEGGLQLTAQATTGSGIYTAEIDYACDLEISGANTKIRAFSPRYPFANFYNDDDYQGVTLKDGLGITEPEGARFHGYYIYDKNGNSVQNQWVTISQMPIEGYAVYTSTNKTLTFYYDNLKQTRSGKVYSLVGPQWYDDYTDPMKTQCQHVVFDSSFADFYPTSLAYWFYGFNALKNYSAYEKIPAIKGMEYLNTSEVTTMQSMFDSSNIGIGDVDFSNFDTRKVTNMMSMFFNCTNIYSLDLSSFDTQNVTRTGSMFYNCKNLETIYVDDTWTMDKVSGSFMMFDGCTNLKGERGTTYDENHTDAEYARVDGGASAPGYFTYNHLYPLWVKGVRVSEQNYNRIFQNQYMSDHDGLARYLDDEKTLILYNVGVVDFSGDNKFAIANGWPERGIKGIDGLTIIADGTVNLRNTDHAMLLNDCETTIIGDLRLKTDNGYGIVMKGNAKLNLLDASLSIETPRDRNCIHSLSGQDYTKGKAVVNVDHSELYLTGGGIYGLYQLNLDGSYFTDVEDNGSTKQGSMFDYSVDTGSLTYGGSPYYGDVAITFDKEAAKEFRIKNGDKKTGDLLLAVATMTSYGNGFDLMYNPVLTCKTEGGIEYYYRTSDNKLLFTVQGNTFHLAPEPEDISAPTYAIKPGLLPTLFDNFRSDNKYLEYWALVNRYNKWTLHFMPDAVTAIDGITHHPSPNTWYTIDGQRIEGQPTHKGIYITNGRKVVVK